MAVQYKAHAITRIGGAPSGSLNICARGPTKTILKGYKMEAKVRFQAMGESVPANHSPFMGSKIKLVINTRVNAEMRKIVTNFFLEIFILLNFYNGKSTLNFKVNDFTLKFKVFEEKAWLVLTVY
jgi:hypothetical protein